MAIINSIYEEIVDVLDLQAGDSIHIASDMTKILWQSIIVNGIDFDLNLFIDAVQRKIGNAGTLMFPTFNWGFCRGKPFDYLKTPCLTGSLGKAALKRSDFVRTRHPIYSFAVWGREQRRLFEMDNVSAFGGDSPFAYLHEYGKSITIDVPLNASFTFTHYVEEQIGVTYRYIKNFEATYIDLDGNSKLCSYAMYVRDLEKHVISNIEPLAEDLLSTGVMKKLFWNRSTFLEVLFCDFFDFAKKDILENKAMRIARYDT